MKPKHDQRPARGRRASESRTPIARHPSTRRPNAHPSSDRDLDADSTSGGSRKTDASDASSSSARSSGAHSARAHSPGALSPHASAPDEHAESARASSADSDDLFADPESGDADAGGEHEPVLVRLNKYLADHGVASRRKCDELIAAGQVTIDGDVTTQLGQTIDPTRHTVEIDGFVLKPQGLRRRYYLLNKPGGVVCTNEVRETRPRAVDLITDARKGRIYTVGRLDEESKGLILLTNDGEFANRIMHPRYGVEKTYLVRVAGKIDDDALTKIREGVHLSEGRTSGARVLVNKRLRDQSLLTLTLREGMNREIRRAFAQVGFKVLDLKRTRIGPLSDRGIKIGRWRELTREEVAALLAGRNDALERRDDPRRSRGRTRGDRHSSPRGKKTFEPIGRPPKIRSGRRGLEPRSRDHAGAKRDVRAGGFAEKKRDDRSRGFAVRKRDDRSGASGARRDPRSSGFAASKRDDHARGRKPDDRARGFGEKKRDVRSRGFTERKGENSSRAFAERKHRGRDRRG